MFKQKRQTVIMDKDKPVFLLYELVVAIVQ